MSMPRGITNTGNSQGQDANGKMNLPGYTSAGPASGIGITGPTGVAPSPRPARSFAFAYPVKVQ